MSSWLLPRETSVDQNLQPRIGHRSFTVGLSFTKGPLTKLHTALKGSAYVNKAGGDASPVKHEQYYTLVLSADSTETGVEIEAGADGTEVVLISGEPLDQEVVQYGPFGKCYTHI